MSEDWKAKEQEALNEGHHWAILAGLEFDKTWEDRKPHFNLYRKGQLIASVNTAWQYRDLAYDLCPYYQATPEERQKKERGWSYEPLERDRQFIAQVIEAIEPETEEELLTAILDNKGCNWGMARSMFRQYRATKSVVVKEAA